MTKNKNTIPLYPGKTTTVKRETLKNWREEKLKGILEDQLQSVKNDDLFFYATPEFLCKDSLRNQEKLDSLQKD